MTAISDTVFVAFQRILPARLLGRIVYRATRSRRPWLKNALIRWFVRSYGVDTTEMSLPRATEYPSFNAFFTRELRDGARIFDPAPDAICCPADGTVQQIGNLAAGRLLQVKGIDYALTELLGINERAAAPYAGGAFLTIYLAPHNYHRVHMPLAGRICEMRYLPGRRLAVNEATARTVPGLFAGNERVAVRCEAGDDAAGTSFWIVFVGALNVASVTTAWAGEVTPERRGEPRDRVYEDAAASRLAKGEYCGHFNMGSTIVLVLPGNTTAWDASLAPGNLLRVGQRIGTLIG